VRGTTLGPAEVPMWFPEKLEDQFDGVMTFDRFTMARRDRAGPEHARAAPDSFGVSFGFRRGATDFQAVRSCLTRFWMATIFSPALPR
jgi:hypothetical protein